MHVICSSEKQVTKTKQVANLFDKIAIRGRRVLVLLEDPLKGEKFSIGKHDGWIRCMKNLPKAENTLFSNVNGYELALSEHVLVTEEVLQELIAGLRKASE
jgi:ribosomal protein L4